MTEEDAGPTSAAESEADPVAVTGAGTEPVGAGIPVAADIPVAAADPIPEPSRPAIPLVRTRALLPAAFDLIARSNEDMRRASFYIGAVTLGTVGPFVLGLWALILSDRSFVDPGELGASDIGGPMVLLGLIATLGFIVAAVESRTLATAVLGARMAGRPITLRHAVGRARARFWSAVGASFIVGIILSVCQVVAEALVSPALGEATEASAIVSTVVTAVVGAPFAYVLSGVVLGDVGALESIRRSVTVARARWSAAAIIVTFETIAILLILFGLSAGGDLLLRVFGVLGIGPDSGPAGLALATLAIIAAAFALGTLLYTVTALTVAPQVVMFVGLTHATVGLDRPTRTGTRWFSNPMLLGVLVGGVALVALVDALG